MIDEVRIDTDEDGFHLLLTGDMVSEFTRYLLDPNAHTVDLRLSQDAAIQLNAQARGTISPWVDEMEHERAAYDRATPEERARVLRIPVEELT